MERLHHLDPIVDRRAVTLTSRIDVVRAQLGATANDTANVVGLTGMWKDTSGDGILNSPDLFVCTGNATSVFIT